MLELREACLAAAHQRKMGIIAMKVVAAGMMGNWASNVVPGTSASLAKRLPEACIRWTMKDERIDHLVIGMRDFPEVDRNIRTMAGDTTYTARDRSLLREFSGKVMKSDDIRKMKVE